MYANRYGIPKKIDFVADSAAFDALIKRPHGDLNWSPTLHAGRRIVNVRQPSSAKSQLRTQAMLSGVLVAVVAVAVLYLAQAVLVPIALAVFLTFLLAPLVTRLQNRGLGRTTAVVIVVTLAAAALVGTAWMVTSQVVALVENLPTYTDNIKEKVKSLQQMGQGKTFDRLERMLNEILQEFETDTAVEAPALTEDGRPRVIIEPASPSWFSRMSDLLGGTISGLLEPLGTIALAVVLCIFMLLKREDLRNRFIRLVGNGRLTATTRAVDEAGDRISRFLLMQLIVNGSYGLTWAAGLWIIGVDYALLWGFLATILRYIPYIGAPIAAMFPIAVCFFQFDGWSQLIQLGVFLVALELVSNNVLEPWLYGRSMGVSVVALIVGATFWAYLWGPIGLILSSPLTVCLVVLGRHVPQLEFMAVLLGDEPALEPADAYYQRLLAGDKSEALEVAEEHAEAKGLASVFDAVLLPTLLSARRDRQQGGLTVDEEQFVFESTREVLGKLHKLKSSPQAEKPTAAPGAGSVPWNGDGDEASWHPHSTIVPLQADAVIGCPAHHASEELSLEMLSLAMLHEGIAVDVLSSKALPSDVEARISQTQPAVVFIAILPPGGVEQARYLCKRIRKLSADVKIVVGYWGDLSKSYDKLLVRMRAAGASYLTTSLQQSKNQILSLLPSAPPAGHASARNSATEPPAAETQKPQSTGSA